MGSPQTLASTLLYIIKVESDTSQKSPEDQTFWWDLDDVIFWKPWDF